MKGLLSSQRPASQYCQSRPLTISFETCAPFSLLAFGSMVGPPPGAFLPMGLMSSIHDLASFGKGISLPGCSLVLCLAKVRSTIFAASWCTTNSFVLERSGTSFITAGTSIAGIPKINSSSNPPMVTHRCFTSTHPAPGPSCQVDGAL